MTKAPYIVYTPDEDFVLTKDDVNGGGGGSSDDGVLILNYVIVSDSEYRLDKTWQEIFDAMKSGKICVISKEFATDEMNLELISSVRVAGNDYDVISIYNQFGEFSNTQFRANASDGYPFLLMGN